jgi:hypothetical protein
MATKNETILSMLTNAPYRVGALLRAFLYQIARHTISLFQSGFVLPPLSSKFGSGSLSAVFAEDLSAGSMADLLAWLMADSSAGLKTDRCSDFQCTQVVVIQLLYTSHLCMISRNLTRRPSENAFQNFSHGPLKKCLNFGHLETSAGRL